MNSTVDSIKKIFGIPALVVLTLWVIHIFKLLPAYKYGLQPRVWDAITGIFTSPLIHSGYEHLSSNSVPLFVLMSMILFFYRRVAIPSIIIIYLFTGIAVWLFARPANHIGASGVVYGLVSFMFWSGLFRRNMRSIVLALVILIMYSGYFHGILPNQEGISWESHLFGAIVGIFAAYLLKGVKEEGEEEEEHVWEDEEPRYFFPRDLFEKTLEEREMDKLLGDD